MPEPLATPGLSGNILTYLIYRLFSHRFLSWYHFSLVTIIIPLQLTANDSLELCAGNTDTG